MPIKLSSESKIKIKQHIQLILISFSIPYAVAQYLYSHIAEEIDK